MRMRERGRERGKKREREDERVVMRAREEESRDPYYIHFPLIP